MVAIAIAALFATLVAVQPAGAVMKGSMVGYNTALAQKACKSKKGKARATCLKKGKAKGLAKTRQMMSTESGLYGYGLPVAAIPARNGTLIWSKPTTTVAGAARTDFLLYSSKSFPGNRKVAVSGTFSVPDGNPPAGGWPVITWAHGTTGIADQCAPSKLIGSGDYYGSESTALIEGWLDDGYAVLKTDYEGLGSPGVHPYLSGVSQARGVLDIVRAARTADTRLSKKVIITGHSQGGHAALFAAQEAPKWSKDFNHLGTVPYAPPGDFQLQGAGIGALPPTAYGISALAATILRGAMTTDSSIDPEAILTPEALALFPQTETICLGELTQEFTEAEIGPGELLKPGVLFQPAGAAFLAALGEMDPEIRTNRPVLIVQGRQDTTVQPGLTDTLAGRLASLNPGLVDYLVYGNAGVVDITTPGPSTHSSILIDAKAEVDSFLSLRFGLTPP